jgi:4-amino-4-deoxy-L-arabinose transferase-like glycosyltransferase
MASKKTDLIFIGLLTLLAFALRVYQLGASSLWYDELLELDVAQSPFWQIGPQLDRHAAMPLDYYLLHGWIKLGRQETWLRFPAFFFGVLAIPLVFKLAACLFNPRVGYLAALLFACASFAIDYSQEVRPYALLLVLTTVSFLGIWRAYQTGRGRYWTLAIAGLAGAALTHYFALFLLLPLGLFVAFHFKQKRFWQHTAYFGLCVLILLVVFTLNGRLRHLYNVSYGFSSAVSQPEIFSLSAPEKPNRGSGPPQNIGFFVTSVLMPLAASEPISLLCYSFFLFIALLALTTARSKNRWAMLLLFNWLFWPITLVYLFLLQRGTFFAVRYILYTLPAFIILVAYGIEILLSRFSGHRVGTAPSQVSFTFRQMLAGSLLVVALTPLIFAEALELQRHYQADSREDWRAVGQLLRDNASPDDAVIVVNAEPAINWYYSPASAPFGTFNRNANVWEAIQQHQRRWFVLSSYSFKRDKGLRDWLRENHAVTIAIDRRVVVHLQQEGLSAEELLDQVRAFALPQKALTYVTLADQFKAQGDLETSRAFYQRAIGLAGTPAQRVDYETRLAALNVSQ